MPGLNYTASTDIHVNNFGGRSNWDNLQIINGATVTVDENQTGSWRIIDIQNGKLLIQNTSSTQPLRFLMGRGAGATANTIIPASGLGIVEITGSWIELGKGDGLPNDTFNTPYTDYISAVWVETSSGSNQFEPWMNLTSQVGEAIQYFKKDLEFAYADNTGKFFYQQTIKEPYPWSFTGSISGSGLPVRAGVSLLYSSSIYFGDGLHDGNVIPSESRVRIPNIMITDTTPLNLLTATSVNSANFSFTLGGVFKANCALFDESYANFSQAQSCELRNCAFSEYPLITECYSLIIDNVALCSHPVRRYWGGASAGWITRDLRWGTQLAWNYISNASINNLYICNHGPNALFSNQNTATAATTANTPLYLAYCNNLIVNNLKIFQPYKPKNFQYGLITNYVNDSIFNNTELYGGDYILLNNSSNNIFNNITTSFIFSGETPSYTSAYRIGTDPNTNQPLVLGQKYYIKTRAYRNWQDPTGSFPLNNIYFYQTGSEFVDSLEYSITYYTASRSTPLYRNHPDYFGVIPAQSARLNQPTSSLTWVRRDPSAGYAVFRSSSAGFTARDNTSLVYSSSTVATVTFNDTSSVSKPLLFDTPYYYVLRKYDVTTSEFSDSAEQECIVRNIPSASNFLLQSADFTQGVWVKTGVTVTADQKLGPIDVPIATSATNTADQLLFTSTTGNIVQTGSVGNYTYTVGAPYMFSVYLSSITSSVPLWLSASSGTTQVSASYTVNQRWIRATLPFTANATSATVGIFGNSTISESARIYAVGAQVNSGSMTHPYVPTTTARTITRPISHELTSVRNWSRGDSGCGIEIQFGAVPAGTLWWELYMSTSSNFTPGPTTKVGTSWANGASQPLYLNNSSNNIFKNLKQVTPSGYGTNFVTLLNASSNNRFLNFNIDYNYAGTTNVGVFAINTLANNNFFHNWNVLNYRNYLANDFWIVGINNAQGVTLQNIYSNNSDIPYGNAFNLNVALKNVSTCNGRPSTGASSYTLGGSGTDQNAIAWGQVYDSIFNEFKWDRNSGSMNLNFNASSKDPQPYKITGSLLFSNTGRLYFNSTGSIEYEWPWKIYGISGFRKDHTLDAGSASVNVTGNAWLPTVMCNTIDLGDDNLTGFSLKKEISFDSGSGYGNFVEMKSTEPEYVSASFDPNIGFKMKVKLTSQPALKFDNQGTTATSSFIIGQYVTGSTSTAKALIVDQEDRRTTGTLILTAITGSFFDNEVLAQSEEVNKGLANGTGSVSYVARNQILLPQPTSYIASMQWFTITNSSSLYPISTPTLTLTGLASGTSSIDIIRVSDSYVLDSQKILESVYTYTYDYFQNTDIYIVIQNLGYNYMRLNATLTDSDLIIPVVQSIDRNYNNPINV